MIYSIFRKLNDGSNQELAQTRYREDADAILDRWYAGFITKNGEVVRSKRMGNEG